MTPLVVRPRREADLEVLAALLAEQREAGSEYPLRWPLPFPVRDFLVRPTERRAWVAERAGEVVGHVAVTEPGELRTAFADALEGGPGAGDRLAVLSGLFTGLAARGTGAGGLLHDSAVAAIRAEGERPVLDVVPTHAAALGLYRSRGWREVGVLRPPWLPASRPDLLLMTLDDVAPG